jgi:hypothetical protein
MTDAELLRDAIDVTGLSPFRFATEVLDVDENGLQRWLSGDRPMPVAVRAVCMTIRERPALVAEIVRTRNESGGQ